MTLFLNAMIIAVAVFVMYQYSLSFHMNGRMMDVYNRLQVEEGSFKLPHDMEVSQAELREHCETASNWRGQNGAFRKIHVATYGKEQEVSLFLSRLYSLLMHDWPKDVFKDFPLQNLELNDEIKVLCRHLIPGFAQAERKRLLTETDVRDVLTTYAVHRSLIDYRRAHPSSSEVEEQQQEINIEEVVASMQPVSWVCEGEDLALVSGVGGISPRDRDQDEVSSSSPSSDGHSEGASPSPTYAGGLSPSWHQRHVSGGSIEIGDVEEGSATLRGFFDIRHPQLAADILFCEFDNPSRRRKLLTKHLRMFGFEEIVDSGVPAGVSRWHHKENNFTPTDPYLSIRLGTVPGVQCENMLQESVRPGSHCQAHHVVIFSQNLFEHDHQLFRHFVRGPDGSVCEVLTEPDLTSPENYHYGLNCWNPRRIDFWLQKVAPFMVDFVRQEAERLEGIIERSSAALHSAVSRASVGVVCLKHGRRGFSHLRFVRFDRDSNSIGWMAPGKPKTLKSIPLSSITGVTRGRKTELLRRRGKSSRDRFYFSLIATHRTLDLEMDSVRSASEWASIFQQLLRLKSSPPPGPANGEPSPPELSAVEPLSEVST